MHNIHRTEKACNRAHPLSFSTKWQLLKGVTTAVKSREDKSLRVGCQEQGVVKNLLHLPVLVAKLITAGDRQCEGRGGTRVDFRVSREKFSGGLRD